MPSDKIKKKIAINDEQKLALTNVLEKKLKKRRRNYLFVIALNALSPNVNNSLHVSRQIE